ncbi:MAG: gamma carbonic anhydrase family protein [Bacteroidetes bacterium]|nr:MAG: gamma carbonic anhydrase family protein [Bacteroidota bacterium]
MIQAYKTYFPQIAADAFLADNATLIGQVRVGSQSSIWYQAVLRGDVGAIHIGERSSIQDGTIIHCTTGRSPVVVGNDVIVGHRVILHGCTIEDEVLVGMGAIVLDEARLPSHCLLAAGALVPEGMQLESGYLYAGIPARKIKALRPEQIEQIRAGARHYVEKAQWYRSQNSDSYDS